MYRRRSGKRLPARLQMKFFRFSLRALKNPAPKIAAPHSPLPAAAGKGKGRVDMFWTDTAVSSGFIGWWWLIPVICIILCMFSGHRRTGRRWCCGRHPRTEEIQDLRKEIQELKERIGSTK
jgi:hypothetical protein